MLHESPKTRAEGNYKKCCYTSQQQYARLAGYIRKTDNWAMSIAQRIKQARETSGLSKSALARRLGVHPSTCIQWESPGGTSPSMKHLVEVAKILDVNLEWLGTGRGDMRYREGVGESRPNYGEHMNADERRLLEAYRALSEKRKKALLELLK